MRRPFLDWPWPWPACPLISPDSSPRELTSNDVRMLARLPRRTSKSQAERNKNHVNYETTWWSLMSPMDVFSHLFKHPRKKKKRRRQTSCQQARKIKTRCVIWLSTRRPQFDPDEPCTYAGIITEVHVFLGLSQTDESSRRRKEC